MADIRELYQQGDYEVIVEDISGKNADSFSDENDVYRIGRAFQKIGDYETSLKWFERLTIVNPIEDSYRRYLEVNLKIGNFEKIESILSEMEKKCFFSEYYYAAKYEKERINGSNVVTLIDILSEMIKENKIAYYMIALAILYVRNDQTKEAGKVLRKVVRLFDGNKSADYAIELSEAIDASKEKTFVDDNKYLGEGLFGIVNVNPKNKSIVEFTEEVMEGNSKKMEDPQPTKGIVDKEVREEVVEEEPDLSVISEKKKEDKKEGPITSNRSLLQSLGIMSKSKNTKSEENDPIPDSVSKSMENIVGFEEISDMLSTFYTYRQMQNRRKQEQYSTSDLYTFAIKGKRGFGTSTATRVVATTLYNMGIVSMNQVVVTSYEDLVGKTADITFNNVKKLFENAVGKVIHIDHIEEFYKEGLSPGMEAVSLIEKEIVQSAGMGIGVVITGAGINFDKLLKEKKKFAGLFMNKKAELKPFTAEQLRKILDQLAFKADYGIVENEDGKLVKIIKKQMKEPDFEYLNTLATMVDNASYKMAKRIAKKCIKTDEDYVLLFEKDFEEEKIIDVDIEGLLEELDSLTGLASVKEEINMMIANEVINQERKQNGQGPTSTGSLHLVFQGSAGTGKTTVARIIGEIYKGLGILSKGHTIETDYSGLVAKYIGQTATKTKEVISEALGGVLFIDEAYTLADTSRGGFGQEAIDTLLKAMEDNREDFMVIVAGYQAPMQRFIESNEGLNSRFKTKINFEDYSSDEMFDIFKSNLQKNGLIIDEETEALALMYFQKKMKEKNFGNARGVRNKVEELIKKQNLRISKLSVRTVEDLQTIRLEDFYQLDSSLMN